MAYKDFHNTVLSSEPYDWRCNRKRYIYLPDIDIQIEGELEDFDVPEIEDRERFENYVGTSRYGLYYRNQFITGNNFVCVGDHSRFGAVAIPFPFAYTDDFKGKTAYCSILDYRV